MFIHIRLKTAVSLLCAGVLVLLTAVSLPAALRGKADETPRRPADGASEQAAEGTPVDVPILMYHSVCVNDRVRSDYYITPEKFEGDLQYLKHNGYTAVFISELADYAEGKGELPEKPVALTFDDGYYNWLTDVLPLLERYDMKGTFNVVGAYAEKEAQAEVRSPAYSYLTWEEIKTLAESGRAEIGSHTWDMHELGARRGCKKMKGEAAGHYAEALTEDLSRLQTALKENCDISPATFAYPYGEISKESVPVLQKLGFRAALTCDERVNKLVRDPSVLFSLGRVNRASRWSTEAFMGKYGL
ncbi:MAG: polysaccharide deacetylase family protein [Clostridia bacterium]|nr:polysaccharide deacetylase family protein [Clostridia bacterium]